MDADLPLREPLQTSAGPAAKASARAASGGGLQVFIDGAFYPEAEARVSVFDHTLLYGDGVFEGIRLYNGRIFRLKEHLDRIYDSAHYLMLNIPMSREEMTEAIAETVRRNGLRDGYVRLVVTRGKGTLGLDPHRCERPTVFIIAATIQLYPPELYEKGMKIMTAATRRNLAESLNGRVKSCNYLNNILAKLEARNSGYEEALMLDAHGFVVECTGDNIFIVKGGVISTPPVYLGALAGVTRGCVIELAHDRGRDVREEPFTRYEVFTADECFLTGTAAEVIPVVAVDERRIGDGRPGPVTREMISAFRARTQTDGHPV